MANQPFAQYGAPYQTPPPQGPPQRKSSGGKACLIIAIILGVLLVLGGIAVAVAIYFISQNPELRKIASVVGEGMKVVKDAQEAPGTSEMRDSGCSEAFVFDTERLVQLGEKFTDATPSLPSGTPKKLVVCQVPGGGNVPSCEEVAKTYLGAAPKPDRKFAVMVQDDSSTQCSQLYDPDGASLGDFDSSTAPQIPDLGSDPDSIDIDSD